MTMEPTEQNPGAHVATEATGNGETAIQETAAGKAVPAVAPASPPSAPSNPRVRYDVSLLQEQDLFYFNEGTNYRIYEKWAPIPLP